MDTFFIGELRRTHGINGAIKVETYSGETSHFLDLTEVELVRDGESRSMTIRSVEVHNGIPVVTFEGFNTPEEIRRFTGWKVKVDRRHAAPIGEDEYYIDDLIGSELVHESETVGTIIAVVEGSQGELLEVQLDERYDTKGTVLIPFLRRFIGRVDVDARHVELIERWIIDTESRS